MRILTIPDVHLKPYIFEAAARILDSGAADLAVCLMDIPDDWGQEQNRSLYEMTFDAAIGFARQYPETLFCWGNHDLAYVWNKSVSGHSYAMSIIVNDKIKELQSVAGDNLQYVHLVDNVLFSHAGLGDYFSWAYMEDVENISIEEVVEKINRMKAADLWCDASPLWLRPQYGASRMFREEELIQVAGHTPAERIFRSGSLISCDTFSTYRDGTPIGDRTFLVIDTGDPEKDLLIFDEKGERRCVL